MFSLPCRLRRRTLVLTLVALVNLLAVSAHPYQSREICSLQAGHCSISVEADDQSRTLRLWVRPESEDCHIAKDTMLSVLRTAFSKNDPPKLEGTYSSLYIGRLIDYPWLSRYLAETAHKDTRWDAAKGKPVGVDINKYVAGILSRRDVTAETEAALGESGYRVASVSVEKVLVGGFRSVPLYQGALPPGKVPYDAQVWFRLERM